MEEGVVIELGLGASAGGRRPILLDLNPQGGYLIGLSFNAHEAVVMVADLRLRVLAERRTPLKAMESRPDVVRQLLQVVHQALVEAEAPVSKLLAIGIGAPGVVDARTGVSLLYTTLPEWKDVRLTDFFAVEYSVPIYVDNNVRLMALAEHRFGAGKGHRYLVYVGGQLGLGLGIVIDGEVYQGASPVVGEIGHLTLEREGPKCACGKRGCLEVLASNRAILQQVRRALAAGAKSTLRQIPPERLTVGAIWEAAAQGDAFAESILSTASEYLGVALGHVINLFSPSAVVISQDLSGEQPAYLKAVERVIRREVLALTNHEVQILSSALGARAGPLGALALAWRHQFQTYLTVAS